MKKFFSAKEGGNGEVTKGYEIYINPKNVAYCEASGETTWIYFIGGKNAVRVLGKIRDVVCDLEKA